MKARKKLEIERDIKKQNSLIKDVIRTKLEQKEEIERDRLKEREIVNKGRKTNNKEKENSDSVVKAKIANNRWKIDNNDNLREKIDERLKLIKRSITYTQNSSLAELTKKIEFLNTPLDMDRKREIVVLNTTELSDNEKPDRHDKNTICHKCKRYGHTKKQCDRHNKIAKQISKLEFEKDSLNKLMEIFNVSQKEIDQVKKKKELKSTNPLKDNKRKRKKKI